MASWVEGEGGGGGGWGRGVEAGAVGGAEGGALGWAGEEGVSSVDRAWRWVPYLVPGMTRVDP